MVVKVKMSAYLTIYLHLLLIALIYRPTSALFEGCDYRYIINPGVTILQSPYFPRVYPASTSCRYEIVAPHDYNINFVCDINLDKAATSCSTEFFYVAKDGDIQLRGSSQYCGVGRITGTSQFRILTLAYASYGRTGRFNCTLTATPVTPCQCGWSTSSRILNGQQAAVNEFPSMVAIKDRDSNLQSFCGGTILTHRDVLTAAHCYFFQPNVNRLVILAGYADLTSLTASRYAAQYYVSKVIVHPDFNSEANLNDIAIYQTSTDIEWTLGVGPVCLPPANGLPNLVTQTVTLTGWGTTSLGGVPSALLRKANQFVIANDACQREYQDFAVIDDTHVCTADLSGSARDTCQYDSGGPVYYQGPRQYLIGCITFGLGCGYSRFPVGVNSRVTAFVPWIKGQLTAGVCDIPLTI